MMPTPEPSGRDLLVAPVSLSAWQIECCVRPPGVGDGVAWPVVWVSTGADGADDDGVDHLGAHRRVWVAQRRSDGVLLLVDGALVAGWSPGDPTPETGPVQLTGELVAVLHGDGAPPRLPTVHGWVRRVRVTSQLFVPRDHSDGRPREGWVPVAGTGVARQVAHSPHRFAGGLARARPDAARRAETGVLVDLAIEPCGGPPEMLGGTEPGRADSRSCRWWYPLEGGAPADELADPCNVLRPGDPCPRLRTAGDARCPARWFATPDGHPGPAPTAWWCQRAAGHPGQHIAGVPGSRVAAVAGPRPSAQ